MGGIYIQCGSFHGNDKSGSAIDGVLDDLALIANSPQLELIVKLRSCLDGGEDYAMIEPADADALAPLLERYRARIEARIAPITNPFDQMEKDHGDDPNLDATAAKYGKGLGWRYYCVLDLEQACRTSRQESKPVVLTWD